MGKMLVAGIMVTAMLAAGPACRNKPRITAQPVVERTYEAGKMADKDTTNIIPKKVEPKKDTLQKAADKLKPIPPMNLPKLELKANRTKRKIITTPPVY